MKKSYTSLISYSILIFLFNHVNLGQDKSHCSFIEETEVNECSIFSPNTHIMAGSIISLILLAISTSNKSCRKIYVLDAVT